MHASLAALIAKPIAHRGLHDGNVSIYENTRSAFVAAIDKGYGIELDVQLSSDGQAIVFHDSTLDRLTALSGPVRERTAADLAQMMIGTSTDGAEPLGDILMLIGGRVPVVVEMKDNGADNALLAKAVTQAIGAYDGPVAVMSFAQDLLRHVQNNGVNCPVGLTAEGVGSKSLAAHVAALDIGIDFVSYHVHALPNAFVSQVRAQGLPVITWTVRTPDDADLTYRHADQITFEGFAP
ncbi:MAG: glycerophosphodiester phosphodiesterase family protein [Pseudomonadota bacterium]